MTKKAGNRFNFLDEVAGEPATDQGSTPPAAPAAAPPVEPRTAESGPYLFRQHPRGEPQAPLGNRIALPAKHVLEDYVRGLKRAGYPATEARVLEGLLLLLQDDPEVRARLATYLTGRPD
ncbi:hypothetical protein HNQ07_004706 [Deinococcus metalli]|uniref:Uncharacterized protein n=1 Tax=Deinococcus metalli TaxID=1141878 RepID=A0A7W8NRP5_9DEIO|nr:hypothetical protein [Deinococcus metalli]MBB5379191.1 hypothetical protein [Deinococcus metalli]GHF65231.1 hypothetical protein GCM10017781_46210 [Deinococcus metalli]